MDTPFEGLRWVRPGCEGHLFSRLRLLVTRHGDGAQIILSDLDHTCRVGTIEMTPETANALGAELSASAAQVVHENLRGHISGEGDV
jgi:hypothetical protein